MYYNMHNKTALYLALRDFTCRIYAYKHFFLLYIKSHYVQIQRCFVLYFNVVRVLAEKIFVCVRLLYVKQCDLTYIVERCVHVYIIHVKSRIACVYQLTITYAVCSIQKEVLHGLCSIMCIIKQLFTLTLCDFTCRIYTYTLLSAIHQIALFMYNTHISYLLLYSHNSKI